MNRLIPTALIGALIAPSAYAQTSVPECSRHLAEPTPGQVLSVADIDANNACLTVMQQAKTVSDLSTAIRENEKKLKEQDKPSSSPTMMGGRPTFDAPPTRRGNDDDQPAPPPVAVPPTYDTIWADARSAGAVLHFSDGSTQEVERGTVLPDGSTVAVINTHQVILRQADKTMLVLRGSSEAPAPTRIIAVPGMSDAPATSRRR